MFCTVTLGDYIAPKLKLINYHFWIEKVLKTINKIIFGRSTKNFRNKFVIKIKVSLLDRRDKSMHYPESPKVTVQ